MTEGIIILKGDNNILKDIIGSNKIFYHWVLQAFALILSIIGCYIAFQSKIDKKKAHFKSWHGLFGLLGFIFAILGGLNGVLTLYNRELKDYYSPKLNKFIHVVLGTLAYLFGGISAILSVYTKWFDRRTYSNYIVFIIALLLIICIIIWTLLKPLSTVSQRFRQLISVGRNACYSIALIMSEEYNSDCSVASDYGLLKKALPFDTVIPDNFDPNKIPQTAEEFLQYACYERSLMKPWTTAKIDPSKLCSVEITGFEEEKLYKTLDSSLLPTKEWQSEKLNEFREFRDYIQSKMEVTSKDILKEKDFTEKLVNSNPDYEEVMHYSQVDKIRTLELINQYLSNLDDGTTFGDNVGTWIYSMLSLLDTPLISDDCYVVRNLAKQCIRIRSNYRENDPKKFQPFNLFICLISKFFGQLDLGDP